MALVADIEELAASLLPSDPTAWCDRYKNQKPKIIHDALWGTFTLKSHEVALLDTPLLQRLRFIHQTGATSLTYPCALHTRFEHTMGVMFQADRMLTAIKASSDQPGLFPDRNDTLRYAALLHDTGHGPFSHTSEQYYSAMPDIGQFKKSDEGRRFSKSGGGEILSCLIVESAAFKAFAEAVLIQLGVDIDAAKISQYVSGTADAGHIFMSEIIHGPFDADKLDYLHRDGMFSGLKMNVDIDRLYASINLHYHEGWHRIAGSMSGTSPLMQIMFNKMLLYTGIYHHHKVRAVDCMLWAMFELAVGQQSTLGGIVIKSPVDFLRITDDRLLIEELTDNPAIKKLIEDLRQRRLWKRALVISRSTVDKQAYDTNATPVNAPYQDLQALQEDGQDNFDRKRELANKIWEAAGKPCEPHEIWIDIPQNPSFTEAGRTWIKSPGHSEPVQLNQYLPIQKWVELYEVHRWQSHVFCPNDVRSAVNKAAISVLESEFDGLKFTKHATEYCKLP